MKRGEKAKESVRVLLLLLVATLAYLAVGAFANAVVDHSDSGVGWSVAAGLGATLAATVLAYFTIGLRDATQKLSEATDDLAALTEEIRDNSVAGERHVALMAAHNHLLSPNLQIGRSDLHNRLPRENLSAAIVGLDDDADLFDSINAALSALDGASFYADPEQNFFDQSDFDRLWGPSLARMYFPAMLFIECRTLRTQWHPWPYLRGALERAHEVHAEKSSKPEWEEFRAANNIPSRDSNEGERS